jgi:hypothetical protein
LTALEEPGILRREERDGHTSRVLRGGSWNNNATNLRSANRNRNTPGNRNNNYGVRVVVAVGSLPDGEARFPVFARIPAITVAGSVP